MRTRYDILTNWGAWKAGQYVLLKTVPTELIQMGVLEEFGDVATFEITHDENCDITYDDTVDYEVGDTVVFQITKTPPNMIRSLLVNDIEMVELINHDDMTLTLTVAQLSNVINITSGLLATVTVTDDASSHTTYEQKTYFIGDTVIFNLSFDEGYELDAVTFNGVDVKADVVNNTLTKVLIAAANTLSVFAKAKTPATVTVNDSAKSHTTYEQKTYYIGDTVTFNLSFDEGYELDSVTFNSVDVTADVVNNTLTKVFTQATNNLTVNAKAKTPATVTINDDSKSHTTYEQKTYYVGDTVIFNLSFDEGHELNTVAFNGVDVKADVVNNTLTKVLPIAANTLNVTSKTTGQ